MVCVLLSLHFQSKSAEPILFSAYAEDENIKITIKKAQQALNQKLYEKSLKRQQVHVNDFTVDTQFLTVQNLGRRADGKKTKVVLWLTKTGYLEILSTYENSLRKRITNLTQWQSNGLKYIYTDLRLLFAFLSLDLGPSLRNIQENYSYQYLHLKKQVSQLTHRSKLKFVGELEGADIYINGIKRTNIDELILLPGKHIFDISKPDYLSVQGEIYLNPGEQRSFFISLIKTPKVYTNVRLNLSFSLKKHQKYIKSILSDLGISSDEDNNQILTFNMSMDVNTIVSGRDSHAKSQVHKKTYFVSIETIHVATSQVTFKENWSHVYNISQPKDSTNNIEWESEEEEKYRVKEVVQKALYYFYYKNSIAAHHSN